MIRWIQHSFVLSMLVVTVPAHALGWFSRACRWADIPSIAQYPATVLFEIISPVDNRQIMKDLRNASSDQKLKYWVFESITADYGETRYYLYAEARLYAWINQAMNGVRYPAAWAELRQFPSTGWLPRQIPDVVVNDSRLQLFFNNRTVLYSARAGNPQMVDYAPEYEIYRVLGSHSYYDPNSKRIVQLEQSNATDCNWSNWGIESFGWYR